MHGVFNRCIPWSQGYAHYNSHLGDFYNGYVKRRVASVNNRNLDLDRLGQFRISRFIRDPRDLVVSGYFYHLRGAEPWVTQAVPTAEDWYFANGAMPGGLRTRMTSDATASFANYLQSIPQEEGLLAELEFRRHHLESMARWPTQHRDIITFRYEDILGNETQIFRQLFAFYEMSPLERTLGQWLVKRYSLRKMMTDPHVRDPSTGQWRQHFTPRIQRIFDAEYGPLVKQLGYPSD